MRGKKFICIITVMAMMFALVGCQNQAVKSNNEELENEIANSLNENEGEIETVENVVNKVDTEIEDYGNDFYDNSYVHKVNVSISDEDWADLLANPLNKTKYQVNVEIDGETVNDVSFATKGNTSLTSIVNMEDCDRYSFKLNFDKFVEGQTYYGIDKINLNNIYADATYMKDFLSYEIFKAAGVDASKTSFVELSINGEVFGLYLAIEEISDSYLDRVNMEKAEIYKPETEQLDNAGNVPEGQMGERPEMPEGFEPGAEGERPEMPEGFEPGTEGERPEMPEGFDPGANGERPEMPEGFEPGAEGERPEMPEGFEPGAEGERPEMPEGFGPGGGKGGFSNDNGASLVYTDDNTESYTDIFDNSETKTDESDWNKVIEALKALSTGEEIEKYFDVEEIIRYFAAHNFVLNYDSYTGNMLHNYYLLENGGQLSIIPWDYNLAFGTFSMRNGGVDATAIINCGIDSPLSGTTEDARPLWKLIASNEEYLNLYHQVYSKLIEDYFNSGVFEEKIDSTYNLIRSYVENDPTAFYTVEEFDEAYKTLKSFCLLRAESIEIQLSGELSTVTNSQAAENRVDGSSININTMGEHNMGKGGKTNGNKGN